MFLLVCLFFLFVFQKKIFDSKLPLLANSKENSLESFVLQLALLAGDGVLEARTVAGVDDALAQATEAALAWHQKQRRVEERVVLAQVFLALVAADGRCT